MGIQHCCQGYDSPVEQKERTKIWAQDASVPQTSVGRSLSLVAETSLLSFPDPCM